MMITLKKMMYCRRILIAALFWIPGFFLLTGQESTLIPPDRPRLVIGIVIDQMRYDYIYRYWDKFGSQGFKRLINEGTFCKNAQFNYLFTQSSVGYATIATGAMPSLHGIVSEEWYQRLKKTKTSCTFDQTVQAVGGSFDLGQRSPRNMLASTIADEIRLSSGMRSKVFGISLKEQAAILLSGHTANAAYWYDTKTGTWMTSSFYTDTLPGWVTEFNNKKFSSLYLDNEWKTLLPLDQYTESLPDASSFEKGLGAKNTFPYDLSGISRINRRERNMALLASTPFGNTFTKDFAISLIVNESLGRDADTDYLAVNFSATGEIGLNFGPNSVEMQDTYLRLDQELAHFFDFLDKEVGKKNMMVFLTSNHGVSLSPDYLEKNGIPAGFFNLRGSMSLLSSYLNVVYGNGDWVEGYSDQQIFLNRELIEDSRLFLDEIQSRVARFMAQFAGVANTITATTLETTNFTGGIFYKIQNGFNQKRSGDVIINFEPGWVVRNGNSTGHNTSYRYDSHVPLVWYGWKIKRRTLNTPVDMTSIAPTIAIMMNISFPGGATGQPIFELLE